MSSIDDDDPTMPPPGRRSGAGMWSIVPYLKKSLAAKPQATAHAGGSPEAAPSPSAKDCDIPIDGKAR
jgi:hypothetical protein